MKSSKNFYYLGLLGVPLAASILALPELALAQQPNLLAPTPALPVEVSKKDLQPGYVMPSTPEAFRSEKALVIPDSTVGSASADLRDIVQAVDDRVNFKIRVNGGMGYDSNTKLTSSNEVGGFVTWVSVGASVDVGDQSALGLYYGVATVGNVFAYDSKLAQGGRNLTEPMVNAYVGMRGAKTNVRVSSMFRLNNGNIVDYTDTQREQRRAQSKDYNVTVFGQRTMDHGYATGSIAIDNRNFARGTRLNDTQSLLADTAWFYRPGFAPKTNFGLGMRAGQFDTTNNVNQSYLQPSLRVNYNYSSKTTVFGRLGYDFRNYDGTGSIGSTQSLVYELGSSFRPTTRLTLRSSVYKDFNPSVVSRNEDFNRAGVRGSANYMLPWWSLRLGFDGSYEHADYFSTLVNVNSVRRDDYWLFGTSLGRNFDVGRSLTGNVTAFYYYTTNASTVAFNNFADHFTGVRVGVTY